MNQGISVFTKIREFLPQRIFDRMDEEYDGNKSDPFGSAPIELPATIDKQGVKEQFSNQLLLNLFSVNSKILYKGEKEFWKSKEEH